MADRRSIEKDYKTLASTYDTRWQQFNRSVYDWIAARTPADKKDVREIIDLGCGTGEMLALLADKYPDSAITGLDVTPAMLEQARRKLPDATFLEADCEKIEPDRQYDMVLSLNILHHLRDPAAHLRLLRALCRDGGTVFLSDFSADGLPMILADAWWRFFKQSYNRAFPADILRRSLLDTSSAWTIADSAILRPDRLWRLQIYKTSG